MNLLFSMFLIIGAIWCMGEIVGSVWQQVIMINNSNSSSTKLLGIGDGEKKSKVKMFDKKPVSNPEVENKNNNNNYMQGTSSRIPDMRGVGYGSTNESMSQLGGGNLNANIVIGENNLIKLAKQTGNTFKNKFSSVKQTIGSFSQVGENISTKTLRGKNSINQNSSTMVNEFKGGRIAINQNANSQNTIKIKELNTQEETGKNQNLISQYRNKKYAQNIINNVILPGEGGKPIRYTSRQTVNEVDEPENGNVSGTTTAGGEAVPVATGAETSTASSSNENTASVVQNPAASANIVSEAMVEMFRSININQMTNGVQNNIYSDKDLSKATVNMIPNENINKIREVKRLTNDIAQKREREIIVRANMDANKKFNLNDKNRASLNARFNDPNGKASTNLRSYVENNFATELHVENSEEMEEIKKKALEITEERKYISLEEKEKEYERIKNELIKEREEEKRVAIEEETKNAIIQNPEIADVIIGKEDAEIFRKEISGNERERDLAAINEIIRRELKEQQKYLKRHSEYAGRSYDELYRLRRQELMQNDLQTAINQVNGQEQNSNNTNNIIPNSALYMTRQARESANENENAG